MVSDKPTNQQRQFVTHLLGLMPRLPGLPTFRHMSRYSLYHERTFARHDDTDFDWLSPNEVAITNVAPSEHDPALVMDARFVSKSGQQTYGLDRFWNGSHSRMAKGLDISTLAWLDVTANCAYCHRVAQTPPCVKTSDPEATRMEVYLDQRSRVVKAHDVRCLRDVVTNGADSKQKCVTGVRTLRLVSRPGGIRLRSSTSGALPPSMGASSWPIGAPLISGLNPPWNLRHAPTRPAREASPNAGSRPP